MRKRQLKKLIKKKHNITPLQIEKLLRDIVATWKERLYESILVLLKEKQTTDEETEDAR